MNDMNCQLDAARIAFINANTAAREASSAYAARPCAATRKAFRSTQGALEKSMRDLTSLEHQAELAMERELYATR
jgi:hypothetical protein